MLHFLCKEKMTERGDVNERMKKEKEEIREEIPRMWSRCALLQMGLIIFYFML